MNELLIHANESVESGDIVHAIWLLESVRSLRDNDDPNHDIRAIEAKINRSSISDAIAIASKYLSRTHRMLESHDKLQPEEWMLIVSDLSSAHAVYSFAEREGRGVNSTLMHEVMTSLHQRTQGYTSRPFRDQLLSARSRYPNPLPEPLGELR